LQGQLNPESLSQWWYPLINDPYEIIYVENLLKVLLNAIDSVGIALSGLFIAYFLYGTIPFHSWNIWDIFEPLLEGGNPFPHFIYNWSFFRGCIDGYYDIIFVGGIQILVKIKKNSQWMDNRWIYQWTTHPKLFDAVNCESKQIQIECRF
jgi:NAD(P)H-quinone oxidoreductase subunit 5